MLSEKESRLSYDRAMINCIREDGGTHTFFKSRPPVRGFTLFFKDPQVTTIVVLYLLCIHILSHRSFKDQNNI